MWRRIGIWATGLILALLALLIPSPVTMRVEYPANVAHYIVIHHAASGADDFPDTPRTRRFRHTGVDSGRIVTPRGVSLDISAAEIDQLHRAEGFDEIGYHYVVRFDGTVEKGRAEDLRGAHARQWDERGVSYNASSIGVCFAGNCDAARWTLPQQEAGYRLILELMRRYDVPPERVIGHRECGNDTHCPGELVDMDAVREKLRGMDNPKPLAQP